VKIDEGDSIDIVYLDFSKAFGKVPHAELLYKLRSHGIRGRVYSWIAGWLMGRVQRVVLNGYKSSWKPVCSGVPQGSVLEPLLFMLFVNDLEYGLGGRVYKFADDTKLVRTVNAPEDCIGMQRDLDKLVGWARRWRMSYNVSKCQVMHFGGRNPCFSYDLEGVWLSESSVERDLGVLVSTDLKCGAQCLAARNRANGVLGYINRLVGYKSREVIVKVYAAFVMPHLEYALPAWAPHYRKDVDMLESISQRRARRLIPRVMALRYNDRLDILGMYSLERRRLRGDLSYSKCLRGLLN